MRASITRAAQDRSLCCAAWALACSIGLWGCPDPELRVLASGLTLRVLPACAPQRVERVVVEPLGDFAAAPGELVSSELRDAPVRLRQLPTAAQWFRLEVDADGFRGAALGRASETGEQHDALILPLGRTCPVLQDALPDAAQRARALVRGSDLLIAGGTRGDSTNATQEAFLLHVADPKLTSLPEEQRLAVARAGAAAVSRAGEVWLLGGVSNLGPGSAALDSYERYDAAAGGFTGAIGRMRTGRYAHAALALADGSVLVAGGRASIGGEPLTSIEHIAADGATSTLWKGDEAELPFAASTLSLHLRDDGRVIAFGQDADKRAHFALLEPRLRRLLPLVTPGQSDTQRMAAGVALPGGRFAVFELECQADTLEADDACPTSGRVHLSFEGETGFQTLTDWLGSFEGLRRPRALALADGRILLSGTRGDEPALRILNLGNREVASRSLDIVVDGIFMREDGSVLLVGPDGARVLREDALSAFDNPGGTLTADDSDVLCLDAYGRFAREGLGLRANVAGARFDLATLRYQAVRITLHVEGKAQLLLRPEVGDARLIDLGGASVGPAFCQLTVSPGEPVELERRAESVRLRAGSKQRSCRLEGITGAIGIGLVAETGTLVRELRVERL
jgi:hypothetical protein